jgi:hypothetical protein
MECVGSAQRRRRFGSPHALRQYQSGVALRLPPHSIYPRCALIDANPIDGNRGEVKIESSAKGRNQSAERAVPTLN